MSSSFDSILIVDDSAVQRSFVADYCREFGCATIHEAKDGQSAIDLIATLATPPDLAIVDLEMPGMDGVELMQQMYDRDFHIPLIVASGRGAEMIDSVAKMIEALGLPLIGSLQKPLRKDTLFALLRSA